MAISRAVWCPEDGYVFCSQSEAAAYYGVNQSSVSKQIRGKIRSVLGKTFEYVDEAEARSLGLAISSSTPVKVRCLNDDTVWPSISEAAKHYGIDPSLVSKHVRGKFRQAKGYKFEKVEETPNE